MVQITHNIKGPCVQHACHTCRMNHTHGYFRKHMCVQYLHICVVFYTCVHAYMFVWLLQLARYLVFSLTYNATIMVTQFFCYKASAAHHAVEDKIAMEAKTASEVESRSLILQLGTNYLTEALLLLK